MRGHENYENEKFESMNLEKEKKRLEMIKKRR